MAHFQPLTCGPLPHGQVICPDMEGDTVFTRLNKLRHQFRIFYMFRYQSDRSAQVMAPVIYLMETFTIDTPAETFSQTRGTRQINIFFWAHASLHHVSH